MKIAVFAAALTATALTAGAASAGHSWTKHGKTCFYNKYGKVVCTQKHGHFKAHKPAIVVIKRGHGNKKFFRY